MIRGLMVAFLASAAAAMVYGQGMMMQWQAQIPQTGGNFYYPVSCQNINDRYRDSSLYDYDGDGVLDLIETIDIYDVSSNFLGDSILVFDGATNQLKFSMYVNVGYVQSPCFIEMDSDGKKELFCIIHAFTNNGWFYYPTWFDIANTNIKYQIGPFRGITNLGFVDVDKDTYTELLCQVTDTLGNNYFQIWGFSPLAVKPSPIGLPKTAVAKLFPSSPNPFRTSARIEYFIPKQDIVLLTIFNAQGRVIRTLVNELQKKGSYATVWDGKMDDGALVSSGAYFYKLTLGSTVTVNRQMIFLK
jgi:hypothetical protein